jgi:hypothetical protein
MRSLPQQSDEALGFGGEKLSAFLHSLSNVKRLELNQSIKEFST